MTLRVKGDVPALARAGAKAHGLISRRFYGSGDEILVVDGRESEDGFRAFFAEATEIPRLMAEVGVRTEPEIAFWRQLDTHDAYPA